MSTHIFEICDGSYFGVRLDLATIDFDEVAARNEVLLVLLTFVEWVEYLVD